jgi:hypothetical protein
MLVNKVEIPFYDNAHVTSTVHTWALFFLRHLASSALAPFRGARVRIHACPEEVVYRLNDSCSHFTQSLFPPNVP